MKVKSFELLEQLQADIRQVILTTGYLEKESLLVLTLQPAAGQWSVAQVLEHLNSYGRYYLPAIEKSLAGSTKPATVFFRPRWLGNYFTKIMRPGDDGRIANRMKAPKDHTPVLTLDVKAVLGTFIQQQHRLLDLLEEAKTKDIGSIRTPVSISRFITMKTGDTFRFLIAHEQRHFVQVGNIVTQLKKNSKLRTVGGTMAAGKTV
jgi:uncharacterized damage-inducible protein DinB